MRLARELVPLLVLWLCTASSRAGTATDPAPPGTLTLTNLDPVAMPLELLRRQGLVQSRGSKDSEDYAIVVELAVRFRDGMLNADRTLLGSLRDVSLDDVDPAEAYNPRRRALAWWSVTGGGEMRGRLYYDNDYRYHRAEGILLHIGPLVFPLDLGQAEFRREPYVAAPGSAVLKVARLHGDLELDAPAWAFIRDARWTGDFSGGHVVLETTLDNRSATPHAAGSLRVSGTVTNPNPVECVMMPLPVTLALELRLQVAHAPAPGAPLVVSAAPASVTGRATHQSHCESDGQLELEVPLPGTLPPGITRVAVTVT
ncbi:MAG TPA: hypothetical protein VK437_14035, partial [Steroidobacteraceae bacterium]|nr:hypothetical protein [Steroidobacteraceae bacterium]